MMQYDQKRRDSVNRGDRMKEIEVQLAQFKNKKLLLKELQKQLVEA